MKKLSLVALMFVAGSAFANCESIDIASNLSFGEYEDCENDTGLSVVMDDNTKQYGFVNNDGKLVISTQFDEAWSFQEGLALIKKDDKWGYIKTDGSYAIKPSYDDGWGFSEGLAKVQKGDKVGFINAQNQTIIPIKYNDSYNWFNEGLVTVSQGEKWAVMDKKGKALTKFEYDYASSPAEDRILVGKLTKDDEMKFGFVDSKGKLVIPMIYDFSTGFDEGTALVMKGEEVAYINTKGEEVELKEDYSDF